MSSKTCSTFVFVLIFLLPRGLEITISYRVPTRKENFANPVDSSQCSLMLGCSLIWVVVKLGLGCSLTENQFMKPFLGSWVKVNLMNPFKINLYIKRNIVNSKHRTEIVRYFLKWAKIYLTDRKIKSAIYTFLHFVSHSSINIDYNLLSLKARKHSLECCKYWYFSCHTRTYLGVLNLLGGNSSQMHKVLFILKTILLFCNLVNLYYALANAHPLTYTLDSRA